MQFKIKTANHLSLYSVEKYIIGSLKQIVYSYFIPSRCPDMISTRSVRHLQTPERRMPISSITSTRLSTDIPIHRPSCPPMSLTKFSS